MEARERMKGEYTKWMHEELMMWVHLLEEQERHKQASGGLLLLLRMFEAAGVQHG